MKSWIKYIAEKKDHLIKKIPNLTDTEKTVVTAYFNKFSSLENKIDWNNLKNLTFADFKKVMDGHRALKISKGKAKLGVDYIELDSLDEINKAYAPITWEGAQYLASNKVNKEEGKWCIAYRESQSYWHQYGRNYIFIIYVTPLGKWALQYDKKTLKPKQYWDADDTDFGSQFAEEDFDYTMQEIMSKNKSKMENIVDKVYNIFLDKLFDNSSCYVSQKNLTSLEGCPSEIKGNFDCSSNKLTSLKDAPSKVGISFYCSDNKLTSLKGCPSQVRNSFDCSMNQLTSLEGCPKKVIGDFYCEKNNLTSLKGAPETVGGIFRCFQNNLTSLEGSPKRVLGDFYCNNNKLTSLKGAPEEVGGNFMCHQNNIKSLEGCPKKVLGNFTMTAGGKFTEAELRAVCKVHGMVSP